MFRNKMFQRGIELNFKARKMELVEYELMQNLV